MVSPLIYAVAKDAVKGEVAATHKNGGVRGVANAVNAAGTNRS